MSLWRAELCLTSPKLLATPNTCPFPTPPKEEVNSVLKLILWPTHGSKFTSW